MKNILLLTDSYKPSHYKQIPDGITNTYSYLESRGGKFDNTTFYGLQPILKEYLAGKVVTEDKIRQAKSFFDAHIGPNIFNEDGWRHILKKHGGKLPVRIKAVPEGMSIPIKNVLMTIENTDPEVPWLTNYLESILLQVWYPITVATLSREIKKVILKYLQETTDYDHKTMYSISDFMLHDFGFRGCSSVESSGIGGSAHLVNFKGTDTIQAIITAQEYYNTNEMIAFSIPASEHSTITSWGESGEVDAFRNILTKFPTGLVACVSDSFDIVRACNEYWGMILKDDVLARDGKLIIRPDSGDPLQTLKIVFNILWNRFPGKVNSKGYKVISDKVRVIQGDGVDYESIGKILQMMKDEKFSAENIAFGMGGALLQKIDRDTQKFAFKCSSIVIDNKEIDVRKNPIEFNSDGERVESFKKSKSGRLKLTNYQHIETIQNSHDENGDMMVEVFLNGDLQCDWNFNEVRDRAIIR